jgi:hypothetical protein
MRSAPRCGQDRETATRDEPMKLTTMTQVAVVG